MLKQVLVSGRRSWYLLLLCSSALYAQKSSVKDNIDLVFHNTADMLQQIHYAPQQLDDAFAARIFTAYLQQLDPGKRLFRHEDIEQFKKYEPQLDDELRGKTVQFYKVVNTAFAQRLKDASQLLAEQLKTPFKFTQAETYAGDEAMRNYTKTNDEWKARWKNYLKFQVLVQYEDLLDMRQADTSSILTEAQLEEKARQIVLRIEKRNIENLLKLTTEEEAFNTYINSVINLYDPHSAYFLPVDRREFQENLSGIYYGIGALLQEQQGSVSIRELMIGGPAWKSGQVEQGDVLVKVAQGNEKPVELAGMGMSEVIKLTRGQKSTIVRITFRKKDGSLKEITLQREALQLEDTFVKSAVIDETVRIGYISFPRFYTDFGDANGRSCAADMARELERLKKENVQGIIVDIRNNGGGSLGEVINMVGLFVKEGPVVQVKSPIGKPYVARVSGQEVFIGPLIILVNEMSASASEIFAAAIQDHQRGLIVGSQSTYGKGSVQRSFGISNNQSKASASTDLGTLNITLQKYYRISGGATQLKGILPDIAMPGIYEPYKLQEKNSPTALGWDTIPAVAYIPYGNRALFTQLVALANNRMDKDTAMLALRKNLVWLGNRPEKQSLQLEQYRKAEKEMQQKVSLIRKELQTTDSINIVNTTDVRNDLQQREQFRVESNKAWLNSLKKDLYLSEAVLVMKDYLKMKNS